MAQFPNNIAYSFARNHGGDLYDEAMKIRNTSVKKWNQNYTSSVRRGFIIGLFQNHNLLTNFISEYWPYGNTSDGQVEIERCLRIKEDYENYLEGTPIDGIEEDEPVDQGIIEATKLQFALEGHLRDFLAKNLDRIEKGLRLYEKNGKTGIEFLIDNGRGRIDLLAIDINGKFVVIELKLSQGRNKALGQLLYYMGWIDQNLGNGPSRGIIVASEITQELRIAVSRTPSVKLAQYKMTFTIEAV